jgi:hypothetical protein
MCWFKEGKLIFPVLVYSVISNMFGMCVDITKVIIHM